MCITASIFSATNLSSVFPRHDIPPTQSTQHPFRLRRKDSGWEALIAPVAIYSVKPSNVKRFLSVKFVFGKTPPVYWTSFRLNQNESRQLSSSERCTVSLFSLNSRVLLENPLSVYRETRRLVWTTNFLAVMPGVRVRVITARTLCLVNFLVLPVLWASCSSSSA